jgi:L-fuconate dehydratase
VRDAIGPDRKLMIDANQTWDVGEAIARVKRAGAVQPVVDRRAHEPGRRARHAAIAKAVRPIGVATGEHAANRVIFKQLLQAGAIDFCQIDACRLGGVNENLAVILMAAKFGVPVCPHAGGVGLCEYVQHLAMWTSSPSPARWTDA